MTGKKTGGIAKLPFGLRMKAWWNGFDTKDLARVLAERRTEHGVDEPSPSPAEPDIPERRTDLPWDERRMEIAELVWGEGYCGPGGPENVIGMSKLLSLSPEMSMVVIGAELGGPARTLAQNFGVWISGYEGDPERARVGMALSEKKGMAKKAPIFHYDYAAARPFERRFDRALSKEALFYVPDPAAILKRVEESLKDDGLLLITNYVVADEKAALDREVRQWTHREPARVHMKTPREMTDILGRCGFGVRVNEDITDHYQALVRHTWARAGEFVQALLDRGPEGRPLIDLLLREAELWTERGRLFDSGKLRVWRILAHKKELGTLMSDW